MPGCFSWLTAHRWLYVCVDDLSQLESVVSSISQYYLVTEYLEGGELFDRIVEKSSYTEVSPCRMQCNHSLSSLLLQYSVCPTLHLLHNASAKRVIVARLCLRL